MLSDPFDDSSARRAYLGLEERLRALSEEDRDLVRLGQMPDLSRWLEQVAATGGCARPVYLRGVSATFDAVSGELVRRYSTDGEPGERLALRCRNRRASRCGPCSWLHQGDSWHLVHAGLAGGKGVPEDVQLHPSVFVTLTAPSFGRVHRAGSCHRERPGVCAHGRALGCGRVHPENGGLVGAPVCVECYDYPGHVLWNAHAGALWKAFGDNVYHHLAALAGVGRSAVRRVLRVSAVKVAEYQRRGVVHFHAVVRLDGPAGAVDPPPSWVTADVLVNAVRTAAGAVALVAPASAAYGERRLRFGVQVDVHELRGGLDDAGTGERVAAYVAKYTTKGAEAAGAVDRRVTSVAEIRLLRVSAHLRALVGTCWRLGGLPELAHLRLRAWAHMLGFRGHCLTKTRAYSTTYRSLRAEREDWVRGVPSGDEVTVGDWRYAGVGYRPGEALVAEQVAADRERTREIARDYAPPGGWVGRGGAVAGLRVGGRRLRGAVMSDPSGWAFPHGPDVGPAVWGFTTADADTARDLSAAVGGVPERDANGVWSLITYTSVLRVEIVTGCTVDTMPFRLACAPGLGAFVLRFGAWSLAEVLGASVVDAVMALRCAVVGELAVTSQDVSTLGGRIIRYPVPCLTLRT